MCQLTCECALIGPRIVFQQMLKIKMTKIKIKTKKHTQNTEAEKKKLL